MQKTACPYLGLKEDPNTSLNFPSQGNHCHHAKPISPIQADFQEKFCLTQNHTACPLYRAAAPRPMPPAIRGTPPERQPVRRSLPVFAVPFLLTGIAIAAFVSGVLGARNRLAGNVIPNTGQQSVTETAWQLLTGQGESASPGQETVSPQANAEAVECPLPSGWETYTVAPTDSLYRLSVIYGVSVAELQAANCLEDTVLLPGQVIYIPKLPGGSSLSSVHRFPPLVTVVSAAIRRPANTATNAPPAERETDPPTAVPPTAEPPTAVPPTTAPTNPPPPAPTDPPKQVPPPHVEEKKEEKRQEKQEKEQKKEENKDKKEKKEENKKNNDDEGKGKGKGKGK